MKGPAVTVAAVLLAMTIMSVARDAPAEHTIVEFETTLGNFTVETWNELAPVTVDNFLQYVVDGHYDGLTFHRVAPGFVVQGGGLEPDHQTQRATRPAIVNEASEDIPNEEWTLSMARLSGADTATSQFFINLKHNEVLDKTASSPGYAVFGIVADGFDVIEAMTQVEAGQSFSAGGFYPAEPIVITKATIVSGPAPGTSPPPTPASITADAIVPGTFPVSGTTDQMLVWAQNTGQTGADIIWTLTADGGPLPEGWSATFDPPTASIGVVGGSSETTHAMLTLEVPADAQSTTLHLGTGHSETPLAINVNLNGERISEANDAVTVQYAGTCIDGGDEFDSGNFPLTLGQGRAIAGFDLGLIGMQQGEPATIVIPAPMAYGHDGGPCGGRDPADLAFDVQIVSFD